MMTIMKNGGPMLLVLVEKKFTPVNLWKALPSSYLQADIDFFCIICRKISYGSSFMRYMPKSNHISKLLCNTQIKINYGYSKK
jgi:hypothetical protein